MTRIPLIICLFVSACGSSLETPTSVGPDLKSIRLVNIETVVAQNADIHWDRAENNVNSSLSSPQARDDVDGGFLTTREFEGRIRDRIARELNAAIVDEMRGVPQGELPVIMEVLVTRYTIRGLVRANLLGSDHKAEVTVTLRDAGTGRPVTTPLQLETESTEQVGGLALRAIRPRPSSRLNNNIAAKIRTSFDRVLR